MAKIYVIKILNGDMTIDDVPKRWKAQVAELLEAAENKSITGS